MEYSAILLNLMRYLKKKKEEREGVERRKSEFLNATSKKDNDRIF